MIPGKCTPEGTRAYASAHAQLPAEHWRGTRDLTLASIGMGTYLGNWDDATDANYAAALQSALSLGLNVVDTAVNYRFQRSERAIGIGLARAIGNEIVDRSHVLLCTKGGYIPYDGEPPSDAGAWVEKNLVAPGIIAPQDIVGDCHCMAPPYLKHQIDQSRKNLGVETIDVYYVHNPEQQRPAMSEPDFYDRLTKAFVALEECASEGKIQWYGTATWDGYRVSKRTPAYLSLERVLQCARDAGGEDHRFAFVQLPFNFQLVEALVAQNQPIDGREGSILEAAYEHEITVFTSVPLMQAKLVGRIAPEAHGHFPGLTTDAQRLIQFVRSAPGICAPLVGMSRVRHVEENSKVAAVPPLTEEQFNALFGG